MRTLLVFALLCGPVLTCFGQNRILITEQDIRLKGKESKSIHYACAQGDRISIEMSEAKGKSVGEIQVIEYPNWVRHSEHSPIEYNREFTVNNNCFQEFKITGKSGARVCNVRIFRTPSSPETMDFNTQIVWTEKVDTIWHNKSRQLVTGYESEMVTRTKREIIKIDTSFISLTNKGVVVKAGNTAYEQFQLPAGVKANAFRPEYSKEVVSWSYWIGVGQNAVNDYERLKNSISTGVKGASALMGAPILGQLAATGISLIPTRQGDDYIFYNVTNGMSATLDNGRVTVATKRIDNTREGWITFSFTNEKNSLFGSNLTVNIEAVAMVIEKRWGDVKYDEKVSTPIYQTENYREAEVKRMRVPTFAQ